MVVLHSKGAKGTLRRAAVQAGIPSVTLEAGEPLRLQKKAVNRGVKGLRSLLSHMEMYGKRGKKYIREPHYYKSEWVRANQGGVLFSEVSLGERVRKGKLLGTITDPVTNVRSEMVAPANGRILGMALNQVLMPGFATFRIGIETNEEEILTTQAPIEPVVDKAEPTDEEIEVVELRDAPVETDNPAEPLTEVSAIEAEDTPRAPVLVEEQVHEHALEKDSDDIAQFETAVASEENVETEMDADAEPTDTEVEQEVEPYDSGKTMIAEDNSALDERPLDGAKSEEFASESETAVAETLDISELPIAVTEPIPVEATETTEAVDEDPDFPVAEE